MRCCFRCFRLLLREERQGRPRNKHPKLVGHPLTDRPTTQQSLTWMRTPRPESKGLRGTSASSPSTSLHHARGGAAGQGNTGGAGQHRAGHLSGRTHQSQASSAGAGAGLRAHRARHASWVCWLAGPRPPAPAHLTRRSLMTASCEGSTPTRRRRGRAIRSSLRAGRALAHGWSCLAARVPAMPTQRLGHGHRTTTDTRHLHQPAPNTTAKSSTPSMPSSPTPQAHTSTRHPRTHHQAPPTCQCPALGQTGSPHCTQAGHPAAARCAAPPPASGRQARSAGARVRGERRTGGWLGSGWAAVGRRGGRARRGHGVLGAGPHASPCCLPSRADTRPHGSTGPGQQQMGRSSRYGTAGGPDLDFIHLALPGRRLGLGRVRPVRHVLQLRRCLGDAQELQGGAARGRGRSAGGAAVGQRLQGPTAGAGGPPSTQWLRMWCEPWIRQLYGAAAAVAVCSCLHQQLGGRPPGGRRAAAARAMRWSCNKCRPPFPAAGNRQQCRWRCRSNGEFESGGPIAGPAGATVACCCLRRSPMAKSYDSSLQAQRARTAIFAWLAAMRWARACS